MPPPLRGNQLLIQTISASLNPADYKLPDMGPLIIRLLVRHLPASPGLDFCGRVAAVGDKVTDFQAGQLVYGCLGAPMQFGSLAEYLVCGVAGQTAYQALAPYVSAGDKVLITAGSGGCGIYTIQLAKLMGCHVTTTCSAKNVQFCKDIGADEVIDYTARDVAQTLKINGPVYSHVVDYTGLPDNLYKESHQFLLPGKTFVQVGAPSFLATLDRFLRPAILGGGKSKIVLCFMANSHKDIARVGKDVKEGKIKVHLNLFEFEDVMKAYELQSSGKTRGKIVVHVSKKS